MTSSAVPASAADEPQHDAGDDERVAVHPRAQRHSRPHDPRLQDASAAVEHRLAEHEVRDLRVDALRLGQALGSVGDQLVVQQRRRGVATEGTRDPVEERRDRGEVGEPEVVRFDDGRAEARTTVVAERLLRA